MNDIWCPVCKKLNQDYCDDGQAFYAERTEAIKSLRCTCKDQAISTLMANAWELTYRPEYVELVAF